MRELAWPGDGNPPTYYGRLTGAGLGKEREIWGS